MGRVYQVFDKLSIIEIIVGFALGFYLGVNHDSSNLWFDAIPIIILGAFIFIIPLLIDIYLNKSKHNCEFPTRAIIEAYILNVAILTVCTAFGTVLGSFYIGNYITN